MRKTKLSPEQWGQLLCLYEQGYTVSSLSEKFKVSRVYIYVILNRLRSEGVEIKRKKLRPLIETIKANIDEKDS